MTDLVAFIKARLDEDEAAACAAVAAPWSYDGHDFISGAPDIHTHTRADGGTFELDRNKDAVAESVEEATAAHMLRHDPARVLADVEAKRRILELAETGSPEGDAEDWRYGVHAAAHEVVLRLLALPFADHPDYDESWRP